MKREFTVAQQEAIDTRNRTLLLSAAAGSGKTTVLVERIIRMISDDDSDINIEDLLVVTFTKLAASEMKDKIRKALNEKYKENPHSKKIKKQILNISGANIQTIDSFCLNVIKSNINCIDIPVNFRVADDSTVKSVKEQAFEELFEEKYESEDKGFAELLDSYVYTSGEDGLIKLITSLYNMANSMADPDKFYDMCLENIEKSGNCFENSVYYEILLSHCRSVLENNVKKYENILDLTYDCDKNGKNRDFFLEEYSEMKNLLNEKDVFLIVKRLLERKKSSKPSGKGENNDVLKEVREAFKKDVETLEKYFCCDIFEEEENQKKIYPYMKTLIDLTKEFSVKFSLLKKKKGVLEFSDFEHFALKILKNDDGTPTDTAISYQKKYKEILIDEYQDTSDIQNAIFSSVSRNESNLFMVGDVKQCIYKFRQARPEIFAGKEEYYSKNSDSGKLILLTDNFRSRNEVLKSVNEIFLAIMNTENGMTDYKKQQLNCGGKFCYNEKCDYKTSVLLFDGSDKDVPEVYKDMYGEAVMIAQNIKKLVENEELICVDKENKIFRKCTFSDIVILTRNMTGNAKKIYDTLLNFGIPVTADFADNMFEQLEILMIINALKCIDNPRDDFALLSLLKSPVWRFSETELLKIRNLSKNTPFYDALLMCEDEKTKKFTEKLNNLRKFAFCEDVSKTVEKIYDDFDLYQRFSSFKNPKIRLLNLDEFYKIALEYDKTENGGFKGFIFHIDKISKNPKKVTDMKGSVGDSVRIMTMHKSKGLEFPVVFVSDLAKSFSDEELKGNLLINSDIGIGADVMAKDNKASFGTLSRSAIKCKIINDTIGEEMRLLYVALTRAQDKLFITAQCANLNNSFSKWDSVMKSGGFTKKYLYSNRNFISWIMPTVINNDNFNLYEYDYGSLRIMPDILEESQKEKTTEEDLFVFEKYKDVNRTLLPVKVTVSQANKAKSENEERFFGVTLDELDSVEEKVGGSEYGTYFHKIFELCDLSLIKEGKNVKEIVDKLINENVIEKTTYTDKAILQVENFFATDIGKELLDADEVYKEKPFLVRIEADKAIKTNSNDEILLQGTSDCYFVKNNKITLIDFKTNRQTDEKYIKEEYSKQMELYAYAIEKVTELKVEKKVIYTAQNGKIVHF